MLTNFFLGDKRLHGFSPALLHALFLPHLRLKRLRYSMMMLPTARLQLPYRLLSGLRNLPAKISHVEKGTNTYENATPQQCAAETATR